MGPQPVDRDGHPLRLLLVHAHPDDETTTTGATIAYYRERGVPVTLVTCTRGERGENVLVDPAGGAAPAGDGPADELGRTRIAELEAAARVMGLTDVRFLGGPGAWWDSGMADARVPHPRAFGDGDLAEQTAQLVAVIRETRPQVIVTYDENGGYGHPDHVRAHQVAVAAFDAAADPSAHLSAGEPWRVSKLYAAVVARGRLRRAGEILARSAVAGANPLDNPGAMPFGVPDDTVTTRIDGRDWIGAKAAAMREHRTQMHANGWFFALTGHPGREFAVEDYVILRGEAAPSRAGEPEDDLFAGLRDAGPVPRTATAPGTGPA